MIPFKIYLTDDYIPNYHGEMILGQLIGSKVIFFSVQTNFNARLQELSQRIKQNYF